MYTQQLYKLLDIILQNTGVKKWFVVPRDLLKPQLFKPCNIPCVVLMNSNRASDKSVGHWVVLLKYARVSYFFDPLGRNPRYYGLNIRPTYKSKVQVQDERSALCGLFCILFVKVIVKKSNMQ